jgi:hypothetical protein
MQTKKEKYIFKGPNGFAGYKHGFLYDVEYYLNEAGVVKIHIGTSPSDIYLSMSPSQFDLFWEKVK